MHRYWPIFGLWLCSIVTGTPLAERAENVNAGCSWGACTLIGGTTGGAAAAVTTVTTLSALTAAVSGSTPKIVLVTGVISGNTIVKVGANTSLLGRTGSSGLIGVGLYVGSATNVIIRNLKISKVLSEVGSAITIDASARIWIDHVDLSSDRDHELGFYGALLDVTHGSRAISVTSSYFHDHIGANIVGHANGDPVEDASLQVSYNLNRWFNLASCTPTIRFGRAHVVNNLYESVETGINVVSGAVVLLENSVWAGQSVEGSPINSFDGGLCSLRGNDFGGAASNCESTATTVPYSYTLISTSAVSATVKAGAGATISF